MSTAKCRSLALWDPAGPAETAHIITSDPAAPTSASAEAHQLLAADPLKPLGKRSCERETKEPQERPGTRLSLLSFPFLFLSFYRQTMYVCFPSPGEITFLTSERVFYMKMPKMQHYNGVKKSQSSQLSSPFDSHGGWTGGGIEDKSSLYDMIASV